MNQATIQGMEATSANPVMDDLDFSLGSPGDGMLESPLGLGKGLVPKSILQEATDRRDSVDLGKSPPPLLSSRGKAMGIARPRMSKYLQMSLTNSWRGVPP